MEPQDTCGLFGKLPMQSDFVSHFLPGSLTDYWHGWLQSCLSISQEQLSEQWREYYLSGPIWRFAIMPGIVHNHGLIGILMPSVDEVGRYFPLTIAHAGPHRPWSAYLEAKQWYDSAEHIALLALEDELGYSQYMGYFEQLAVPEYALGASIVAEPAAGVRTHNTVFEHIDNEDPKPNALQLLDFNAQKMLGAYSLWWTEGSDSVVSSLLSCSGLPDSGQFAAMLDGQWQQWGWNHSTLVAN